MEHINQDWTQIITNLLSQLLEGMICHRYHHWFDQQTWTNQWQFCFHCGQGSALYYQSPHPDAQRLLAGWSNLRKPEWRLRIPMHSTMSQQRVINSERMKALRKVFLFCDRTPACLLLIARNRLCCCLVTKCVKTTFIQIRECQRILCCLRTYPRH